MFSRFVNFIDDMAQPRARRRGLAAAVGLVIVATGLRAAAGDLASGTAFAFHYPALLAAAMVGGARAGLLALALSTALVWFLFVPPELSFAVRDQHTVGAVASFVLSGFLVALMAAAMRQALHQRRAAFAAQEKAEAQRREAAAQLATFVEHAPLGLAILDRQGRFVLTNAELSRTRGVTPEEYRRATVQDLAPGEPAVADAMRRVLVDGETVRGVEFSLPSFDGDHLRHYLANAFPLRGERGEVTHVGAALVDITERKRAELILARTGQELERLVRERTAELEEANEKLRQSQRMEALGQLTGGVAHDFNNLLTIVLGNLEIVQRRAADEPRVRQAAEHATQGAQRAATLTRRLLAFSRRQPLQPRAIDVNSLVAGMSELLRRSLGERVVVDVVLAGGLWKTEVDPAELENALLNLAVNARDAMPEGGRLTIETGNTHLDDAYAAAHTDVTPGQYVVICVSDTGSGIAPDVLSRVFEPFFTTKGVGEGTGLGLAQVYGFVKQSGGHVKVYSETEGDHRGTTVKIYMPRLAREERPSAPAPLAATPARQPEGGRRVLVVEDDADVRRYSAAAVTELGHRIEEAEDAEQALALIDRDRGFDLLFTDIGLPGRMNGRALADAARAVIPDLRVLFTSGYAPNAMLEEVRLEPGVLLLSKPFTQDALAAKLAQAFEERLRALVAVDDAAEQRRVRDLMRELGFAIEDTREAGEVALMPALTVVDGAGPLAAVRRVWPSAPVVMLGPEAALGGEDPTLVVVPHAPTPEALESALRSLGFRSGAPARG